MKKQNITFERRLLDYYNKAKSRGYEQGKQDAYKDVTWIEATIEQGRQLALKQVEEIINYIVINHNWKCKDTIEFFVEELKQKIQEMKGGCK